MNDLLPATTPLWQHVEATARKVLHGYGYQEIRLPLLEHTELFARSIGEHTDIVEKEMYTFEDRNGDRLTLRPEGTAGCVRAGIESGTLHNQVQRYWYGGPMFRHERPQKGRYRQFHQIGVECFGIATPDVDAEVILLSARLWRALGLAGMTLEINSLGTPESRGRYREALVSHLRRHVGAMDEDTRRRLEKNPLRVLDSKEPAMQPVIASAPNLLESLDAESAAHFALLRQFLDSAGVHYTVNPRLVRGLDYYTRTVFEWKTDRLGAQSAVCAGGRYDRLVELLGGRPTSAIGFALGMERLIELLSLQAARGPDTAPQIYCVLLDESLAGAGLALAERLRDGGLRVEMHCGGGGMKSQLKRADRVGAAYAILLDADAVAKEVVVVKDLRGEAGQQSIASTAIVEWFIERLAVAPTEQSKRA